ncbi:MAG: hypothetical protein GXY52_01695 [Chloroflexi bacterium]|nr:hypothetical protein [Chloroflexota bacterium]
MTFLLLMALSVAGVVMVVVLRRWQTVVVGLVTAILVAMAVIAGSVSEPAYSYFMGRLIEFRPIYGRILAFCYVCTTAVTVSGLRSYYNPTGYASTMAFTALITAAISVQDGILGALLLGAALVLVVFVMASPSRDDQMASLQVLSVLILIGPLLLLAVWALQSRSLNPNDLSYLQLGVISLILTFALGMGAFPFGFWFPPIVRKGNPIAVVLVYIAMVALVMRLAAILPQLLWPQGQLLVANLLLRAGLITVIAGSLLALLKSSLDGIFAYSVLSTLGITMLGLGIGTDISIRAALLHLIYTGIALTGGSIGLAVLRRYYGGTLLTQISGARQRFPLAVMGLFLCGLSLSGLPLTAGFITRFTIFSEIDTAHLGMTIAVAAAGIGPAVGWFRFALAVRGSSVRAPMNWLLLPAVLCVMMGGTLVFIDTFPSLLEALDPQFPLMLEDFRLLLVP